MHRPAAAAAAAAAGATAAAGGVTGAAAAAAGVCCQLFQLSTVYQQFEELIDLCELGLVDSNPKSKRSVSQSIISWDGR